MANQVVLLSPTDHEGTIHLPIIETVFLQKELDFTGFDSVIFTSKHSVMATDQNSKEWKKLKIFSVGRATSDKIRELGGEIFYEASSAYGDVLASEIASNFTDHCFFYPRAKVIVSDLEKILTNAKVSFKSEILYETKCRQIDADQIPDRAVILFTAPSTVNCFFDQALWREDWRAVAIGTQTAKALDGKCEYLVSPEPFIDSSVRFALEV